MGEQLVVGCSGGRGAGAGAAPLQPLEVDIQGLPLIIRFIMSRDGLSPVIALRHDVPRRGRAEPPDHPAARRLLGRMTWVMCAQEHGGPWYDYVPRRDPLVEGPELAMWTGGPCSAICAQWET